MGKRDLTLELEEAFDASIEYQAEELFWEHVQKMEKNEPAAAECTELEENS